jgi:hypothetical protein
LQSFRTKISDRRRLFLLLAGVVERQLRDAYDRKFRAGEATQSSLAAKLGINRSAIHRRLTGHCNMTIETIADMAWALDQDVKIEITDHALAPGVNYSRYWTADRAQTIPRTKLAGGAPTDQVTQFPRVVDALKEGAPSPAPVESTL